MLLAIQSTGWIRIERLRCAAIIAQEFHIFNVQGTIYSQLCWPCCNPNIIFSHCLVTVFFLFLLFAISIKSQRQTANGNSYGNRYSKQWQLWAGWRGGLCLEHAKQVVVLIIITNCFWRRGPTNDLATLKTENKMKPKKKKQKRWLGENG